MNEYSIIGQLYTQTLALQAKVSDLEKHLEKQLGEANNQIKVKDQGIVALQEEIAKLTQQLSTASDKEHKEPPTIVQTIA